VSNIEHFAARAPVVFLGDAVEVGGPANTAPTVTPTPEPTSTPTASSSPGATSTQPVAASPTVPAPPTYVPILNLTGIGARFRIVADYSRLGRQEFPIDNEVRGFVERALRDAEAGKLALSTCAIDAFVPRYTHNARYLVFAEEHVNGAYYAAALFRVEGERVVFNDPGLMSANNGFLYMERATYNRYFSASTPSELNAESVYFIDGSVPLRDVLRAVAALRGDPSIAPPDTGSAGLAEGR
jgi:hypothetical protein